MCGGNLGGRGVGEDQKHHSQAPGCHMISFLGKMLLLRRACISPSENMADERYAAIVKRHAWTGKLSNGLAVAAVTDLESGAGRC